MTVYSVCLRVIGQVPRAFEGAVAILYQTGNHVDAQGIDDSFEFVRRKIHGVALSSIEAFIR